MQGVEVTLFIGRDCSESNSLRRMVTNEKGHYVFEKVMPGTYSVRATVPGREGFASFCSDPISKDPDEVAGSRIHLRKNDLQITAPENGTVIYRQKPTITWEPYPEAQVYQLSIRQLEPPIILEESTLRANVRTFTPNTTLNREREYELTVAAKDHQSIIAVGTTTFEIRQTPKEQKR